MIEALGFIRSNKLTQEKESVYVPISYEYLMTHLFGKKSYHGHVGSLSLSAWKKDLLKINKYIKKAIKVNVESDAYHKGALFDFCDRFDEKIKKSKTLNEISVYIVESHTRLIFTMLGNFPSHWDRKAPYADRFWELDGHRTISYTQTNEQKSALILSLVDIKKAFDVKIEGFKTMQEALWAVNGDPDKFISWVKANHPRLYCALF